MIIVAAIGQQPSRYEIIIDSACEVDNQLEVLVRITKVFTCGLQAGLLPQAVDIVRLPKTDLPVVFRETEVTSDCQGVLRPVGERGKSLAHYFGEGVYQLWIRPDDLAAQRFDRVELSTTAY